MVKHSFLREFPISFFSIVMGLAGLTIAFQRAESILDVTNTFSTYILFIVTFIFLCILLLYFTKLVYFLPSVNEEFNNPVQLSFFPTVSISFLLLSIAFLEVNMEISKYLWMIGTLLHFIATIAVLSIWIKQSKFEIHHFNPSWFIPIVGNIIVPIAGVRHFAPELSWFFFSIGIIFWIVLLTIFLYRIIFHHPIPEKLLPTFFILIAPPAVGFISYVNLNGTVDNFSRILYYFALFLIILLISQYKMFYKIKFYLSWWAYSFPIASVTIATALIFKQTTIIFYKPLFFILISLLTLLVLILLLYTIKAILKGEIFAKEQQPLKK